MFYFVTAEGTVGFLAYLSCNHNHNDNHNPCDAPPGNTPLVFDSTKYNYGSHYSTSTGKFTAPVSGMYLITSQLQGRKNSAEYRLWVDGNNSVTFTFERDRQDSDGHVMGYTTIVLKLNAGQQVWIDPYFSGSNTLSGSATFSMLSYFGAHLLETV